MTRRFFHGWVVLAAGLFLASAAIGAMAIVLGTTLRPPEVPRAPRPSPVAGG